MTRTISVAPVRKAVRVKASPAQAFEVFTKRMSSWWPPTHSILKVAPKEHVLEPRVGGRWYQVGIDGSVCDNGKVLAWEPPGRLLLAWQINAEWAFDPDLITEVEVLFIADGEATRVELEHRLLERMGEKAESARAAVDAPGGWGAILESFKTVAES
jgi:uncharacterized protein YndB with AHSA1/START domain